MAQQLRDKVASGVAWSAAEKVGSMLLQMVVSIVVARLLMPQDFGVLAILTFFTALMTVVVDSGFSQTLIRKAEPTADDYKSVFVFNVVVSVALYAIMVALAPAIAAYYKLPIINHIAPVLMLLLPLSALCVIQNTIFARQFRFATLSRINFACSALSGAVAIAMACAGCGVWSLVGQRLSQMACKAVLLWRYGSWRCEGRFSRKALGEMSHFSFKLMGTDIISYLYNNIAQLFIGKIYSPSTLGYFNQAQKLKELPVTSAVQSFQSVTYPALAGVKDNPAKLADSYRRVLMITAAVMFPVMTGMVAVADDMFMLLLGERWMPTVPYFKILSLSGLFYPLSMIAYNILKVGGNGTLILRLEVVKKSIMTVILAVTIPHSVTAVAWGLTAMTAVEFVLNAAASLRFARLTIWQLIRSLLPVALLSLTMYLAVTFATEHLLCDMSLPLRFTLQILTGVITYTALGLLFRLEALADIKETITRMVGR
ncbi:MAG: lipopolysaccharide biosynthesis protein [Alistipes sp.]|nr:lipopolysaccharide biosynthesis protein [Alistipes sp.]